MEKRYNIVIADDDSDDQFFLKEAISSSKEPFNLISVFNGLELLDLLYGRGSYAGKAASTPDLVLLDLNMPVMDGFAALAQIRKEPSFDKVPVFIFTTSRRENDKEACRLLGADEFFSKPSELARLNQVVGEIISKVRGRHLA